MGPAQRGAVPRLDPPGAFGAITGWLWGHLVVDLQDGGRPVALLVGLVVSLLASPLLLAEAFARYPRWWVSVMLRVRTTVLLGQTAQRRLAPTPPGEVVARAMDADRFARYADRWVDFANGLVIVVVTAVVAGSALAGGVLLGVMVASARCPRWARRRPGGRRQRPPRHGPASVAPWCRRWSRSAP